MKFPHWLTLLFIGLKLSHYIDWSWWLVLLPFILYIPLGLLLAWAAAAAEDLRVFGKGL